MDKGIDLIVHSSLDPHGADYGIPELVLGSGYLNSLGILPRDRVKVILLKWHSDYE